MKNTIILIIASAVLVFATACGDESPQTGDLCRMADYPNGTQCNGSNLRTCKNGVLFVEKCGDTCAVVNGVAGCAGELPGSKCGSISSHGLCDGDVAKRCHNGEKLIVENCASKNQVCEKLKDTPVQCVSKGSGGECGGVTTEGTCNGQVLQRCINDGLMTMICGVDQICVPASASSAAYCKDNDPVNSCGKITEDGVCDGKTLKYCSGNQLKTEVCSQSCVVLKSNSIAICSEACPKNFPVIGACNGNELQYCAKATDDKLYLVKDDCSQSSTPYCGFDSNENFYNCINKSDCDGYPVQGICVGNELWKCTSNALEKVPCGSEKCLNAEKIVSSKTYVYGYCTASCGSITDAGICVDGVSKYCDGGVLHVDNCLVAGQTCKIESNYALCR